MIKQVISLISLILAIFSAGKLATPVRDYLISIQVISDVFSNTVLSVICYIIAFSLIILGLYFLGRLLEQAVNVTPAASLNRLMGGFLGGFKVFFLLSLIFNLLTIFEPNFQIINKQTQKESVLFNRVESIVPFLYPYLKEYFSKQKIQTLPRMEEIHL